MGVDLDRVALGELALEDPERQLVDQLLLDHPLQRPGAISGVVAEVGEQLARPLGELDLDPAHADAGGELVDLELDDNGLGAFGAVPLTDTGPEVGEIQPAYSPDRRRIAFTRLDETETIFDVWLMGIDGLGQTQLTGAASEDQSPAWEYVYRCGRRRATIVGSAGPDRLRGTRGAEVIVANGGNDRIVGGRGNDVICSGKGNDRLLGGPGRDRLFGQAGPNRVVGGNGRDRLFGGRGRDRLLGERGRDLLKGGQGIDLCRGGPHRDRTRGCERGRG